MDEKHELQQEVELLKNRIKHLESETAEVNVLRAETEEHREYAEQLEKQFSAQVAIIEALKAKLLEVSCIVSLFKHVYCSESMKENVVNEIIVFVNVYN